MPITIKPITRKAMTVRIVGTSPMVQHQWSEKAKKQMRDKHAGKKTTNREPRDPKQECINATYFTADGQFGFPGMAFKRSMIKAAHKDLGIPQTTVCKALFLHIDDPNGMIPMDTEEPIMREDVMRIGQGTTDLRYRPEFKEWAASVTIEFDSELLTDQDVIALINRAGFGVGIMEGRPEKGRDFGRFELDTTHKVIVNDL